MRLVAATDGSSGIAAQAAVDHSVETVKTDASSNGGVAPMTSTPSGYHLYGNNVTAYGYIYNSEVLATFLTETTGGHTETIGQVNVGFQEYLYGGSPYRWKITPKSVYRYGPPYTFKYEYWCGVSVPNASDWTCATGDSSADGYSSGTIISETVGNENYAYIWRFGQLYTKYAKFPMLALHISWPGYPVEVIERFRGWDIRNYSGTWKMAPASGTGY